MFGRADELLREGGVHDTPLIGFDVEVGVELFVDRLWAFVLFGKI
jgi:hypothetical protein